MASKKYVYWEVQGMWIGYLEEYPDYMSQGESLEELKENLKDICHDLFIMDKYLTPEISAHLPI